MADVTSPLLSSTEVNMAMARFLHAQGYTLIETSTLAAQAAELAAMREALHLAASRLQVASVDAIRAGETRLSADCITWANDATRAALSCSKEG